MVVALRCIVNNVEGRLIYAHRRKAPPTLIDVDQNEHDVGDISEHVRMDGDQIASINE